LRKPLFILLALALVAALSYLILEAGAQILARTHLIGPYADYEYIQRQADEAGLDLRSFAERLGAEPVLGWNHADQVHEAAGAAAPADGPTLLFLGDSITFGELATRGVDDYVTLVAEPLSPRGVRVVNAGVSGYGLDQMMLKLPEEVERHRPDWVVVAFIPHDVRRMGRPSFVRLPKPSLDVVGDELVVTPPEDVYAYHMDQKRALDGFRYSPWLFRHIYAMRRAAMPGFFQSWYGSVLQRAARQMLELADAEGFELIFVLLPNYADALSSDVLAPIVLEVMEGLPSRGDPHFVDLTACVREEVGEASWPGSEFLDAHPTAVGHAVLARCMGAVVDERFAP
jgi:lysophospholipase L1-like esterase